MGWRRVVKAVQRRGLSVVPVGLTTDQVSMLREFDPIIFHFRGGTVRRLAIDTVLRVSLLNPSLPGITHVSQYARETELWITLRRAVMRFALLCCG